MLSCAAVSVLGQNDPAVDGKLTKQNWWVDGAAAVNLALDIKVILIPPCILFSREILHTKYTGARRNDSDVYT